jgi:hypothetical protein
MREKIMIQTSQVYKQQLCTKTAYNCAKIFVFIHFKFRNLLKCNLNY